MFLPRPQRPRGTVWRKQDCEVQDQRQMQAQDQAQADLDLDDLSTLMTTIKDARAALKDQVQEVKEMEQRIYAHMESNNLDTYDVGDRVFTKTERKSCPWNKNALLEFAPDGTVDLTLYEEENTNTTVVYTNKKRKR